MSSALAIAAVTTVLRDLLDGGLIDAQASSALGSSVSVSARAPDLIELRADMPAQLNLFLYQVSPNAGWRNDALRARDDAGARTSNPPLALDLHYLMTAYAGADLHAEMVLGLGMQLLHETPMLSRGRIASVLGASGVPALLAASGLADQVEMIKLVPEPLSAEEMSRLWSALQSRYRPSFAYKASVVLIQAQRPTRSALPVLRRQVDVGASIAAPFPTLDAITLASGDAAIQLGETLTIDAHHVDGSAHRLSLVHPHLDAPFEFAPSAVNGSRLQASLPDQPIDIPAGHHMLSLGVDQSTPDGELRTRRSNPLPLAVQPRITGGLGPVTRSGGDATIDLSCTPRLRPGQQVSLVVGDREVFAEPFTIATASARFIVVNAVAGTHRVRLRVDGVDSRLVDRSTVPPSFVAGQEIQIS